MFSGQDLRTHLAGQVTVSISDQALTDKEINTFISERESEKETDRKKERDEVRGRKTKRERGSQRE